MRRETNLKNPDFTVGNIDILTVERGGNYRHSYRNGRTKHGFLYVVQGVLEGDFLTEPSEKILLQQGEMMFIPEGTVYEVMYKQEQTCIRIVQFDLLSGQLPEALKQPRKLELPDSTKLMDRFFRPLNDHIFYHISCLYGLLGQVCTYLEEPTAAYKRLQPALRRLAEHPEENVKIGIYAALCGMSEVNFRRLFTACTGYGPVEYRNDLRLQNARVLLQSGEYNVSESAEAQGFSNLSFFIRLYKQKYGHTPNASREK